MATTIKLKNSVTTTNAPSSLVQGEVAINITDKKVWVGNAATTPIQLLGDGGSASFTSIAFGAGTVSNPSITFTGDTNTGIYSPAADTIAFTEGGVESMRIDSSGNVGIGTSSPSYRLHTNGGDVYFQGANVFLQDDTKALVFGTGTTSYIIGSSTNNNQRFITNSAERMRIDSSGNLLFGVSSITGYSGRFIVGVADGNGWYSTIGSTSTGVLLGIRSSTASIGTVGATSLALNPDGGNVGIGTTSPAVRLDVNGSIAIPNYTQAYQIKDTGGAQRYVMYYSSSVSPASGNDLFVGNTLNNAVVMFTNNTERMRITSDGYVGIGTTTPASYGALAVRKGINGTWLGVSGNCSFQTSDNNLSSLYVVHSSANSNTTFIGADSGGRLQMFCSATAAGGVYLANGGTSWTSASDERVKENLAPIQNGLEKVTSLRAVTGNFINDENKKSRAFLIAQDVQKVFPQAVDSSNPDELGLAYTDVIPLLVAAMKEQQAMIVELSNRIKKLEGVK